MIYKLKVMTNFVTIFFPIKRILWSKQQQFCKIPLVHTRSKNKTCTLEILQTHLFTYHFLINYITLKYQSFFGVRAGKEKSLS